MDESEARVLATQLMLTHAAEWRAAVGTDAALVIDRDGRHHHLGRMGDHIR